MDPGLYIVGTPIGHLGDVTLRALETLRGVSAILAEDTRMTRRLLDRHGISTPMISCHKFNERARTEQVEGRIRAGEAIALVTDSGMPGVSDPGDRMVAHCRQSGLPVWVVPGPSAVTSAIALCGFGGAGFHFAGFLPRKSGARRRELERLLGMEIPAAFFESPFRVVHILEEIETLAPDREIFVARELTKMFEETLTGKAAALLERFRARPPKGEFVIVLGPASGDAKRPDPIPETQPG
ncbi:MAG: 16S rRNA (cytidine(1402)-2'-O)-methyltransferase [Kiritimatiellia bacterium]|nr:16S rRNA (cytidine(1402)-2'-O)-methyltransferase [Kiritimatiellia bacterium]